MNIRRRLAIGRTIGLILAIVALAMAIYCSDEALRLNAEVHTWLDARPTETTFDLSHAGEITVPFHQTCSISHGEALYLQCAVDDLREPKPESTFKDLHGSLAICDSEGHEAERAKFNKDTIQFWNSEILLAGFAPFPKGDYTATIRVDSGASALAGKEQLLYVKYQLCGLEEMPTVLAAAFALAALAIGVVATVCVLPGLLRNGIWRDTPRDAG